MKIIDFGAAKELDPENKVMNNEPMDKNSLHIFQMKAMCGTPEFLSPEVVNYDCIDIYTGATKIDDKIDDLDIPCRHVVSRCDLLHPSLRLLTLCGRQ